MKRFLIAWATGLLLLSNANAQTVISQQPVFGNVSMPPNLLINLSVEFPTVGSAYRSVTYSNTALYLGYFNPNRCYVYDTANKFFYSNADTSGANRTCSNAFSGNFMNYVTMSAIDTFRYGLTGGNRTTDTDANTILTRASLPDNFYNSGSNFPGRTFSAGSNIAPNQVTPFTSTTVYVANCRDQIMFGTSSTGSCTTPGNNANLGQYTVAVKVCDAAEGPVRSDLCQLQTSGSYKPVGEIQRNALKMRFGVMGYLVDNSNSRYGGVLRAPMKYTGAQEFTTAGAYQDNTKKEWNGDTGVIFSNPEGSAEGASGVLNYINKFGGVNGYKTYDPIGELYYEGLRYLMGLQPTPKAVSGVTTAMKDGFPVISTWADPFQANCQQAYTITVGDTNTWYDRELPGNTVTNASDGVRAVDERGLNAQTQTALVGALEGRPNLGTEMTGAGSSAGHLLVGAAYWAHTNDIRPDAADPGKQKQTVTSYAFDVDESSGTTYANRQLHLLAKYGAFTDLNNDKNPFKTVDSAGSTVTNNTEWQDASTGLSSGYFLAGSPDKMIAGIRRVFANIVSDPSAGAAASPSNPNVTSGDAYVFSSRFIGGKWSGEVFRQSIDLNTGFLSASDWSTNATLKASTSATDAVQVPASYTAAGSDKRRIYMWAGSGTNNLKDFCPSGSGVGCAASGGTAMTTAEKGLFNLSAAGIALAQEAAWTTAQTSAATADNLILYLRGRKDHEIDGNAAQPAARQLFRTRTQVLGDVVNSEAAYVKQPLFAYEKGSNGAGYLAYKNTARGANLYLGGNDGMLHAISASTGSEVWAYAPPQVMGNMWRLADTGYGSPGGHRYFVDGTPVSGDVKDSATSTWKTIVVGGFNGGGKGFYALDVTSPTSPKALWNFCTDSTLCNVTDAGVGLSFGLPVITQVKHSGVLKWVVLLTSGHNNDDGKGYLYVLDAMTGALLKKLSTDTGTATVPSGLSKISAWADNTTIDNVTKWAYGGDLLGNVWRFDLNELNTASVLKLASLKDPSGNAQPVTVKPELAEINGNRVVYVGTGKMLSGNDMTDMQINSIYALKDDNATATLPNPRSGTFVQQSLTDIISGGTPARTVATPLPINWDTKNGWFVDLHTTTATGERVSVDMSLDLGTLSVVTNRPKTGACVAGGESWIYYFDFDSGKNVVTGTTTTPFVGKKLADALGTRPVIVRLPNGKIVAIVRLTNNTTLTQEVPITTTMSAGRRISWRELQD